MTDYHTSAIPDLPERHHIRFFLNNFRESISATVDLRNKRTAAVTDRAIAWLKAIMRKGTGTYTRRTRIRTPITYITLMHAPGRRGWTRTQLATHQDIHGPRTARDLHYATVSRTPHNMPEQIRHRAEYGQLINSYDGAIPYWDSQFGPTPPTAEPVPPASPRGSGLRISAPYTVNDCRLPSATQTTAGTLTRFKRRWCKAQIVDLEPPNPTPEKCWRRTRATRWNQRI